MVMHTADYVIAASTLLSPILAVQAQKMVERIQAKQSQRESVFRALMATRGARLSNEHVAALNMIDLVFYGRGDGKRNAKDEAVIEAWRAYLDHLNIDYVNQPPENRAALIIKREDLFAALLYAVAHRVGYKFTLSQIRKGLYLPNAHEARDRHAEEIQSVLPDLLAGRRPLAVKFVIDPPAVDAVNQQQVWQGEILSTLREIRDREPRRD